MDPRTPETYRQRLLALQAALVRDAPHCVLPWLSLVPRWGSA